MLFSDLDEGDVFVLRWWLDVGPTLRHYLVVRRVGTILHILRLEEDHHKICEIDASTFDDVVIQRDVSLIQVYKHGG